MTLMPNQQTAPQNEDRIHFGTGGVPVSTQIITDKSGHKLSARVSGLHRLNELRLDHMEVEFVQNITSSESELQLLAKTARDLNITLTIHASYYINLATLEKAKYHASIDRILKNLWAADILEAKSTTFHPAFYQGRTSEEVTDSVIQAMLAVFEKYNGKSLISLETTGKVSQFGSVEEITNVAAAVNKKLKRFAVSVCVDFAHLHARSNGQMNTFEEFKATLSIIKEKLGSEALQHLHMHTSGINYSNKGERNHMMLEDSDFNYKALMEALKQEKVSGWLVCESPDMEKDALLMKNYYDSVTVGQKPTSPTPITQAQQNLPF